MRSPSQLMLPALAVVLSTSIPPATAQVQARTHPRQDPIHFLTLENDSRFLTDRFYTNGVQLSTKHTTDHRGTFMRSTTSVMCHWFGCDAGTALTSQHNLGQLIFTPRDITRSAAQPEDRPWAGFLYYEKIYTFTSNDQQSITTITGQIGATGPLSQAESAQKSIHRLLDRPRPMGWHNQIGNSFGVNVTVEKRRAQEALSFDLPADVRFNTATYWRASVGTVQTYAAAGVAVVIGKNLPPVSPAPPGIGNTVGVTMASPARTMSCLAEWLQCTAFASVEGRLVAYNVFLDGRLFRNDPDGDKRPLVYDVIVGNRFDLPRTRTAHHGP